MIAVLRAELRAGAPYLLAALLLLATLGIDAARAPLDFVTVDTLDAGNDDWSLVVSLIAFAIGHHVGAGDHKSGAIAFLDGLPVSRVRVFVGKVLAAAVPVLAMSVGAALVKAAVITAAADPWTIGLPAALFGSQAPVAVTILAGFGVGLLLSWLDGLGWGLIIGAAVISLFVMVAVPRAAALHPWEGLAHVPLGARGPLDTAWRLWPAPIGLLGLIGSGVVFVGAGERVVAWSRTLGSGLRIVLGGCTAGFVLLCSGLIGLGAGITEVPSLVTASDVVQTPHFLVLVRRDDRAAADALLADLERIDAAVRVQLPGPELTLDLELAEQQQNHLGQFNGGKIRARLEGGTDTLAHELAHAHAFALCGRNDALDDHVRFFHEGLAVWVAERVAGTDPAQRRAVAAAAAANGAAAFDQLVEDEDRSDEFDMVQAYPLGATFVDALVEVAGPDAPVRVLRAMAAETRAPGAGLAVWYRLADRAGFDLDAVIAAYDARLAGGAAPPPLTARVASPEVLEVAGAPEIWCRFRSERATDAAMFETALAQEGRCEVPGQYRTRELHVGLGYRVGDEPVFGPWRTIGVR